MSFAPLDYTCLSELMADFYLLTGIRISFWNAEGEKVIMAPNPLLGKEKASVCNGNSAFCSRLRQIADIDAQCRKCDLQALQNMPRKEGVLHTFHCIAGLTEYIIPVYYNNYLLGSFMFGQVRIARQDEDERERRLALYRDFQLDEGEMEALYLQLPVVKHDSIMAAARILAVMIRYAYLNGFFGSNTLPLCTRIRQYIQNNYMYPINIDSACAALHVSRSTLSHAIQIEMKSSFISLLHDRRIENVKLCLKNGQSIADAAYNSGFQSVNYMYRLFRKKTGITISEYKVQHCAIPESGFDASKYAD